MGYMIGPNRYQISMDFECLDEKIDSNNEVRVIGAYINSLNLSDLGFLEFCSKKPGQRPYDRKDLLKLHIYGYMNRIRLSRALKRECKRNMEVMWLLNSIIPDHGTISKFVKDNKNSFRIVLRNLTALLRELNLIDDKIHVVDGTKIKAVNSQNNYISINKLKLRIGDLEKKIAAYIDEISKSEKEENTDINVAEVIAKIDSLTNKKDKLVETKKDMDEKGQTQKTITDEDCRGMKNNGKVEPCYNVQTIVDGKHKLIIDCEATNAINDQSQLSNLTLKNNVKEGIITIADLGYFNMNQIIECVESKMDLYISRPGSGGTSDEAYRKEQFVYDKINNHYVCPMKNILSFSKNRKIRGFQQKIYSSKECVNCSEKTKCTTSKKGRIIQRRGGEDAVDEILLKTKENKEIYRLRKSIVERPFGTIKRHWGFTYFNKKRLENVNAETSFFCIAYNLRRLINIVGVDKLISKIKTKLAS